MSKLSPPPHAQSYTNADEAFDAIKKIYEESRRTLLEGFSKFSKNPEILPGRVSVRYPYIKIVVENARRVDSRFSYGFVSRPGVYSTTLTRPDIFEHYYREQISLLIKNHNVPVEIGVSDTPIPIHFMLGEDFHLEGDLTAEHMQALPDIFDLPDLSIMDDEIATALTIHLIKTPIRFLYLRLLGWMCLCFASATIRRLTQYTFRILLFSPITSSTLMSL